uniref:NADH dehydrogenase subunit 2 n=1 Tax=Ophidion muraenolepis TaxID=2589338 RepID=UPI0028FCB2CE|nr:NADH dehydrogenase subunit 2 [Ophidion muraenolepis]WNH38082.1 NADH dehydrogenase subunit 2 [Ophidion muraenolepis]
MAPQPLALLILSIGLGTTITFSTSNWFLAWMGLEINTLAILPLLALSGHPRSTEAATKYFFTQAAGAAMILFAGLLSAYQTGQWDILHMNSPAISTLVYVALALKLGLAPLHTWMPEVLQGVDLSVGLLIATWQKLAPFALMYQLVHTPNLVLLTAGTLSILWGAFGGLDQLHIRKLLAYSSISHLGWVVLVLQLRPEVALLTLALYFILTTSAFLCMKSMKIPHYAAVVHAFTLSNLIVMAIPFALLSLAGLPPLTGFISKLLVVSSLIAAGNSFIVLSALAGGLLSMPIYIRLTHAAALLVPLMLAPHMARWRAASTKKRLVMASTTVIAMTLLPFIPALLALLID